MSNLPRNVQTERLRDGQTALRFAHEHAPEVLAALKRKPVTILTYSLFINGEYLLIVEHPPEPTATRARGVAGVVFDRPEANAERSGAEPSAFAPTQGAPRRSPARL